jgi:hypothetical protein
MRASTIALFVALVMAAATTAQARTSYPTISNKTYGSAKRAAACGGASCITGRFATRGILGEFGKVGSRSVKLTAPRTGNRWTVQTNKLNPDNGKPLASTTVGVVQNRAGKFHFVQPRALQFNLPIVMTHKSFYSAAKAAGAKAMLGNSDVKHWFADNRGLTGSDVTRELRAKVINKSASGKTAQLQIYHRSNGQDGSPMVETTVKVQQLKSGQWRGYAKGGLQINDLWE